MEAFSILSLTLTTPNYHYKKPSFMYFKRICPNFRSIVLLTPYLRAVQRSTPPQPETKSYALHYLITYICNTTTFLCESQFTLVGLIHFIRRKLLCTRIDVRRLLFFFSGYSKFDKSLVENGHSRRDNKNNDLNPPSTVRHLEIHYSPPSSLCQVITAL